MDTQYFYINIQFVYNPIVLFIYMYVTQYYFLPNIAIVIILNRKIIYNNEMLTII